MFSLFLSLLDISELKTALNCIYKTPKPFLKNYQDFYCSILLAGVGLNDLWCPFQLRTFYDQIRAGHPCARLFMTSQYRTLSYLSRNTVGFIQPTCNHLRLHLWSEPAIKSWPLINRERINSSHLEKLFWGSVVNTLLEMFPSLITEGTWQLFQRKLEPPNR